MSYIDMALGIIGLTVAVASFGYSAQKVSKEDAKELEHRLTILEQNQFTNEDRKCLQTVAVKMDMFYETAKREAPDILKHEHTPRYDELLKKARDEGINALTSEEANELIGLICYDIDEMKKMDENKVSPGKIFIAAVYSDIIKWEKYKKVDDKSCQH
jgi:hypothetical protein